MQHKSSASWMGAMLGASAMLTFAGWTGQQPKAATDVNSGPRRPVLVELFTSEGCSSCPPADTLLAKLDQIQPISDVKVIVLSEHVNYWDHEGWRDPYSLDSVTDRQKWYGEKFGLDIYTPQAVVDGAAQVLGSDATQLVKAVSAAVARPKVEITIDNTSWTGDGVKFSVRVPDAAVDKSKRDLLAALAEDKTETVVRSGENEGKTLHGVAVVRVLKEISSGNEGSFTLRMPSTAVKSVTEPLRLVVFLADKRSGDVLGVAEQAVAR
jgi:hypothetical protein